MKKLAVLIAAVFLLSSLAYAWPWDKKGDKEVGKGKETKAKMMEKKDAHKAKMTQKKTMKKEMKTEKKSMKTEKKAPKK